MRATHTLLLLAAAGLTLFPHSSAFGQGGGSNTPFTLTVSVNPSNPSQDDTADKVLSISRSGVTARIRKTNISDLEIQKLGPDPGPFGCTFDVRDSNGNPPPPHPPNSHNLQGGGPIPLAGTKDMVLQPGQSATYIAPLSEWYDLSAPGTYTIQVSQHVSSDPSSTVVKSNKITVIIQP